MTTLARLFQEWKVFLAIMGAGAVTGLITLALTAPAPPAPSHCYHGRVSAACLNAWDGIAP